MRPEAGGQSPEARNLKLEDGDQMLEDGDRRLEKLRNGDWRPEAEVYFTGRII